MSKTITLIQALRKNSRHVSTRQEKSGAKGLIKPLEPFIDLLIPMLCLIAGGAGGWFLSRGLVGELMTNEFLIFQMSIILTVFIFMYSIMKIVNSMFLADDLSVLLTLPFRETQITLAKTVILAEKQYLCSCLFMAAFTLMRTILCGFSWKVWLAALLTCLIIPTIVISVSGTLIILIMRCFRVFRNRNLLRLIGALIGVTLAAFGYYLYMKLGQGDSIGIMGLMQKAVALTNVLSVCFPLSAQLMKVTASASGSAILILFAVLLISVILFVLAARMFYFKAALSMVDAAATGKVLTHEQILQNVKPNSVMKSLMMRDRKMILRTPHLLSGALLMPLFMMIPVMVVTLPVITQNVGNYLAGRTAGVLVVFALSGYAGIFAFTGLNSANIAFSREGASFSLTNTLPIPVDIILKAKRNTALGFVIVCNMVPLFASLLILTIITKLPLIAILYFPVISFCMLVFLTEWQILSDLKNPNFSWENPSDMKKNGASELISILIVGIYIAAAIALTIFLRIKMDFAYAGPVILALFSILAAVIVILWDRHYMKKGAEYLSEHMFF